MKKMTSLATGLSLLMIVLAVSCSKSNEETMTTPATPSTCDTVNMSYSVNVVPILKANCFSCHGNGGNSGGVNLDTYNNVKDEAEDGDLLGTITDASGYPPMPQGGSKLSDCDINIIRDWINRGTQNN